MRWEKLARRILFEDRYIIALNKPNRVIVHPDPTRDPSLVEAVAAYCEEKWNMQFTPAPVHRLDRPISGAIIFGKDNKTLRKLNALFRDNKLQKTYYAITPHKPPQPADYLINYLHVKNGRGKTETVAQIRDTPAQFGESFQRVELEYTTVAERSGFHLLEIHPHSGKTHQIRAQLGHIGCPIVGDVKYGHALGADHISGWVHLHCAKLGFKHPVTKEPTDIVATAPVDPFWHLFADDLPSDVAPPRAPKSPAVVSPEPGQQSKEAVAIFHNEGSAVVPSLDFLDDEASTGKLEAVFGRPDA
eukprot:TRINITY_DN114393_c0_g1_i1.p1 TRINITY_DN114393_c0_g1~~TRINITY_DN114393_c0_g1_i1.p1  ORF type:complete len:302 (+),score=26.00 TRINITY_DN114393_c0_g1_i1:19-924(+)